MAASYIELVRCVMLPPNLESLRMSESLRTPLFPGGLISRSDLLPDVHPVREVPTVAPDLLQLQPPTQQLLSLNTVPPPSHGSFVPGSANGHVPDTLPAPLIEPGVPVSQPAPHSRSPSPVQDGSAPPCISPVLQCGRHEYEEEDDHFVRRWQQWVPHEERWVLRSRSSHPPVGVDNYFYLNVRFKREGENSSLVLNDFSAVLDSLLRTVFLDVDDDTPLEYPIHRLFQKRGVLQSRLDDARDTLAAEHTPDDLTSKAEVFGFNATSGDDTAGQYLTDLVTHLGKLLDVVEAECKQKAKQLEESLANNQIPFNLLEYYYEEGAWYAANIGIQCNDLDAERRIVLVVLKKARFKDDDDCRFTRMHQVNKQILSLEAEYLEWDGVRFQTRSNLTFKVDEWDSRRAEPVKLTQEAYQGTRPITSLFLQRITEETLAKVTERGRLYLSYCRVFYAECYSNTNTQNELSRSDNSVKPCVRRVMIDPFGFHHAQQGYSPHLRLPLPVNTDDNIARFPYWIGGYDLDAHEWQTFRIWDLKPIEYNQDAWKNLILDENTKDLIRALVDSTGHPFSAAYPGQFSKGKNVLLNGSPGTGRMSTVHAVCNLFNRPLLTISAHLTFDSNQASDLAHRVSLAVTWNAVIIVKDADGFLSSAFGLEYIHTVLRQIESHDCIAFWVGARNKECLSSFCAVIDFPELNAAARRRLWLYHFEQVGPTGSIPGIEHTVVSSSCGYSKGVDYSVHLRNSKNLSRYQLDGKTINNIMRSARALADANKEHFSVHHIEVVMKAQRLDILPARRKLTRILMLPAKLHKLAWWIKQWTAL